MVLKLMLRLTNYTGLLHYYTTHKRPGPTFAIFFSFLSLHASPPTLTVHTYSFLLVVFGVSLVLTLEKELLLNDNTFAYFGHAGHFPNIRIPTNL